MDQMSINKDALEYLHMDSNSAQSAREDASLFVKIGVGHASEAAKVEKTGCRLISLSEIENPS